jgi:hypothetical protein
VEMLPPFVVEAEETVAAVVVDASPALVEGVAEAVPSFVGMADEVDVDAVEIVESTATYSEVCSIIEDVSSSDIC